jgi:hypothetical protein
MTPKITDDQWVWVLIQDPGKNEQIAGQQDSETDLAYIPVFLNKEDAWKCTHGLSLDKTMKYEPQAILVEDLCRHAGDGGFQLFVLNADGEIVEKKQP